MGLLGTRSWPPGVGIKDLLFLLLDRGVCSCVVVLRPPSSLPALLASGAVGSLATTGCFIQLELPSIELKLNVARVTSGVVSTEAFGVRGTAFLCTVAFVHVAVFMGVDCCTEGEQMDTMEVLSDTFVAVGWIWGGLEAGKVVGLLFRRGVNADLGRFCCRWSPPVPFGGSRDFAAVFAALPTARTGFSRLVAFPFPSSSTLGFVERSRCTGTAEGLKFWGGFGSCEPFVFATVPGFASIDLLLTFGKAEVDFDGNRDDFELSLVSLLLEAALGRAPVFWAG